MTDDLYRSSAGFFWLKLLLRPSKHNIFCWLPSRFVLRQSRMVILFLPRVDNRLKCSLISWVLLDAIPVVLGQRHPGRIIDKQLFTVTRIYGQFRVPGSPHVYVFGTVRGSWITRRTHAQGEHANSAQKAPGPGTRPATFLLRGNSATKHCVAHWIIVREKKKKGP